MNDKTIIKILIIGVLAILGILFAFLVQSQAAEQIDNFDVQIKINQDASINVVETIQYNFGAEERRGIYRDFPIKYQARGGTFKYRISDISVTDENGASLTADITYPGSYINIKIGDADIFISGIKTYVISYKIKRALNYFDQHDELYWNATGNEWKIPIIHSKATIILPQNVPASSLQAECFAGAYGSNTKCLSSSIDGKQGKISFSQGNLNAYEGLTIVAGWPKGIVYQPALWEDILEKVYDNLILFLPFLTLGLFYYLWYTRGKDPAGRKIIIAEYDAPQNASPAVVGAIIDENVQHKDISSEIIYLAVKGYLKIIKEKSDYTFKKLKEADAKLSDYQTELFTSIFGISDTKKLDDLEDTFYQDLEKIENKVYQSVTDSKYFVKNPKTIKAAYFVLAIIVFISTFFIAPFLGYLSYFAIIPSAIIIGIYSFFMPQRTKKGVLAKEHILGLKEYLVVAEKDRIKFHNAPEKNPELFEKLLPYAMVLNVEKEWAKQFEDIYKNRQPNWYSDSNTSSFNSLNLVNGLSSFRSSSASTLSSRPSSSASSGSSGFSGGGFSGGGGGGGGGGSW